MTALQWSCTLFETQKRMDDYNAPDMTWATQITLKTLRIDNDRYHAVLHYKVQDHFGLDNADILNTKFKDFIFSVSGSFFSATINSDLNLL